MKAATQTLFGKIVMAALIVLLSPLIVYYMVKTAIQARRTRNAASKTARSNDRRREPAELARQPRLASYGSWNCATLMAHVRD